MALVVGRDVPDAGECFGYADTAAARKLHPNLTCKQCDGGHSHIWTDCLVLPNMDSATRCSTCGARKCDVPICISRRHHRDSHILNDGSTYQVGT
jgi:hypothetical protein